jgi:transcriptional regulator with XRE-family HTH domain
VERRAAARIRRERARRGDSVRGLAALLAAAGAPVPDTAVAKIENGERRLTVDEVVAFAKVFGITTDELLLGARKGRRS